jgi:hypothetical protein
MLAQRVITMVQDTIAFKHFGEAEPDSNVTSARRIGGRSVFSLTQEAQSTSEKKAG